MCTPEMWGRRSMITFDRLVCPVCKLGLHSLGVEKDHPLPVVKTGSFYLTRLPIFVDVVWTFLDHIVRGLIDVV